MFQHICIYRSSQTIMVLCFLSSCCVFDFDSMPFYVCSVLCLFNTDSSVFFPLLSPFLLVVCLSPSVCQCCLRLTYFLFISQTFHLSSSLPFHLACSSSGHQCVCLYIVCLPCTRCQFTVCVISPMKFPPLSPVSSHSRMIRLLFWLHVHLLVFPLKP